MEIFSTKTGFSLFLQQILLSFSNEVRELINKRWQHNTHVLVKGICFLVVKTLLNTFCLLKLINLKWSEKGQKIFKGVFHCV